MQERTLKLTRASDIEPEPWPAEAKAASVRISTRRDGASGRCGRRAECSYCTAPADTTDHIWPRSRGGDDHPNNLVPACRRCNSTKASRSLLDDCCPGCFTNRTPSDVDTARQVAFYACRCGKAWHTVWDLRSIPMMLNLC